MSAPDGIIWLVILGLGAGTFLLRFSFLGMIGGRKIPEWVLRHLRYTPVAVLPGLIAPMVLWPEATGGAVDPARLMAAFATLGIGYATRNMLLGIMGGGITLYGALYLLG